MEPRKSKKSAKGDQWMPLFIADYLADTTHLEGPEHGAYLLLLMAYWRNGGPLPNNEQHLRVIARTSEKAWKGMRDTIAAFFTVTPTHWIQSRADEELANMRQNLDTKVRASKAGNAARWGAKQTDLPIPPDGNPVPSAIPDGSQTDPRRTVLGVQSESRTDPPSPSPSPMVAVYPLLHTQPEGQNQQGGLEENPGKQVLRNHPHRGVVLAWAKRQGTGYPDTVLENVWHAFESEADPDGNWVFVDRQGRRRPVMNWQSSFALRMSQMGEAAKARALAGTRSDKTGVGAAFTAEAPTRGMSPVTL